MATITDFDAWLDQADPEGHEELYGLYRCVIDGEDFGSWKCRKHDDKLFVSAGNIEDTLMIASEPAKSAFLGVLRDRYVPDKDFSVEGWYEFAGAMAKDD
jgi:hypothetical protein